jgi:hypothetical protein
MNYGLALTHEPFCDLWYWHEAVAAHFCPAGFLGSAYRWHVVDQTLSALVDSQKATIGVLFWIGDAISAIT